MIKCIIAVGIRGRLLLDLAAPRVQQLDADAADTCLPGILPAVRILVQPELGLPIQSPAGWMILSRTSQPP